MRLLAGLGVATLAVAVLAAPGVVAPAHAAETCQGVTATIVGTPGGAVVGTGGADVVVSNRAASVKTFDGDDLVCITGDRATRVWVESGLGDDEVHVLGQTPVDAMLEDGEDVFIGGPLEDHVNGGASDDGGQDWDSDFDHIETGAGYDGVQVGGCEYPRFAVSDEVDLGPDGGSVILLGGSTTPEADIDGGPEGEGHISFTCHGEGPWTVDNTDPDAGTATATGAEPASFAFHGFTSFGLNLGDLTFRGSDRPEVVTALDAVDIDLGGGDDTMIDVGSAGGSDLAGGDGRDDVRWDPYSGVGGIKVDVVAGRTTLSNGNTVDFDGFERHGAKAAGVTVLGTPGADDLFGTACNLTLRGGAGSDALRSYDPLATGLCPSTKRRVLMGGDHGDRIIGSRQPERLFGGTGSDTVLSGPGADLLQGDGGDDSLNGGQGNDTVLGGAGRDTGIGAVGRDTCRAERRVQCER